MATLDRQFTHSIPLQPAYTGVLEIGNTSPIRRIKDEGLIRNDEPFFHLTKDRTFNPWAPLYVSKLSLRHIYRESSVVNIVFWIEPFESRSFYLLKLN